MKFCKDCEWMAVDDADNTPICVRPGCGRRSPVTGGMLYPPCDEQRESADFFQFLFGKVCGPQAKYFTPK